MTFVQYEFLVFLAVVFTTYWLLGDRRLQNILLAMASVVFYGWVHPWFVYLLFAAATIDYVAALAMERYPAWRRLALAASMTANLGMLGYFKYVDFFIENVKIALDSLGFHTNLTTLGIFLPVGISFYTFQTMSYTIDVYRGQLKARSNYLDYMVFVCYFPQLVAGPVERAGNLLSQVEVPRRFDLQLFRAGIALAMWGGFKKVVIADTIAPYVDKVFVMTSPPPALVWAASIGFGIQILCDFSGYTDIARGVSRMFGIELMENFNHPFLAIDPSDFWRRWHISFSTWIRDYVFIPLGGSKGGLLRRTATTFATFGLVGLWHGAGWNFVLNGLFHAVIISVYREIKPFIPKTWRDSTWGLVVAFLIMTVLTHVGWIIFRMPRVSLMVRHFTSNPLAASPDEWIATVTLLAICALCATPLLIALAVERWVLPRLSETRWYLPVQTTMWAAYAVAIFTFVRGSGDDFIYFQF